MSNRYIPEDLEEKVIKPNKTQIGKILKWNSSRFQEWKKPEVVNDILQKIDKNQDTQITYTTGSCSEGRKSGMAGGCNAYLFSIKNNVATLIDVNNAIEYNLDKNAGKNK